MHDLITAERLSSLIGLIYDCAIDPARWSMTIDAIRIEIGCANASLDLMLLPEATSLLNMTVNIAEPYRSQMLSYAPQITDMWGGAENLLTLPFDEPAVLTRVVPDTDRLWQHPMYLDWAKPQGLNDMLTLWLARDPAAVGVLALGWPADAGPIGERELRLARLLIPHLQRAATINRLLDLSALERGTFAALFDTLSVPILIADGELNFLHANAAGRRTLAASDPLQVRTGKIHASDVLVARALAVAVRAAGNRATIDRQGMGIPVKLRDGNVGALYVLPLPSEVQASFPAGSSPPQAAAIFLSTGPMPSIVSSNLAAALFSFTAAESKVFELIAHGATVTNAAAELGVQESTIKTHLLRIYDKTGLRRQSDLIRMATALAAPTALT